MPFFSNKSPRKPLFSFYLQHKSTYCSSKHHKWVSLLAIEYKLHKKIFLLSWLHHFLTFIEKFKSVCQCLTRILVHCPIKQMHWVCHLCPAGWQGRHGAFKTVKPPATRVHRRPLAAPQDPSSSVTSSSCSCTAASCCSSSCWCLSSTRSPFSCSSIGPSLFASSRPLARFSELSKQPESRGCLESLDLSSSSGSESSSARKKQNEASLYKLRI